MVAKVISHRHHHWSHLQKREKINDERENKRTRSNERRVGGGRRGRRTRKIKKREQCKEQEGENRQEREQEKERVGRSGEKGEKRHHEMTTLMVL
jgi:hypothetical protein